MRITPLDPDNPSTWQNIPCPVDLSPIQAELSRVGGRNEFGDPNFIIVWGQEYRTWDLGKMRIHFDDENIDAIHTPNRWAMPKPVYDRAMAWLAKMNQARNEAFLSLNWRAYNRFADVGQYLESYEIKDSYIKLPSDEKDIGRMARLLPDGWMYLNGLHTFEHIGQQCFYVLQWFRPQEFGKEKDWNELRYAAVYYPETDQEEHLIDVLGPYPAKGQYENVVLRIAQTRTYQEKGMTVDESITREIYGFKEPTIENVIPPLKELLAIRSRLTDAQKDPVNRNASRFKNFRENQVPNKMAWRTEFHKKFDDAKPVGKGNPTNISANKTKVR